MDEARNFYSFIDNFENEESWVVDKQRICKAIVPAKDLRAVVSFQQKHKALEDEMKVRKPKLKQLTDHGKALIKNTPIRSGEVQPRIDALEEHWRNLETLIQLRKRQIEDEIEAYQFYTDANEAESWLNEKMALMASKDYGVDEPSAQALLSRHRDLQGELNAYSGDILTLKQQADKLLKAGISNLELATEPEPMPELEEEEWVNEKRLVPKEIWEDEMVEKLERKMVTEDKLLPHVKALYAFEGEGMKMARNEILILQAKTNADWWSVRKLDGLEGFVPANYVREIEPRSVTCSVPKLEKVRATQKVKKTILVTQVVPVKKTKPVAQLKPVAKRRMMTANNDGGGDSVEKRLKKICGTYDELQDLAQQRHTYLEDSICLFGFFRECDDFEKWMKDKEKIMRASDSEGNVEVAKRKFEKFLTDMSAASKRIKGLDAAVDEFARQGHSQLHRIEARQKQIHNLWDQLNNLKQQKEKNLAGASSVELFNRTCEEAKDWMTEKIMQLEAAEWGRDLKTVQALQRRHENLERELAPIQEKVNRVDWLANSVKKSYPAEKENVEKRQMEIQDMWKDMQKKADERRKRLENAVGQQIFESSTKDILDYIDSANQAMDAVEDAKDVETANLHLKNHQDLGVEIKSRNGEFEEIIGLGHQLMERNPALQELQCSMDKLKDVKQKTNDKWRDKLRHLEECLDLQVFNREADKIDATTKSHDAFLDNRDKGTSLDEVEAILKRHNDFENTLEAQAKILKAFSDKANKLIANKHYASEQ